MPFGLKNTGSKSYIKSVVYLKIKSQNAVTGGIIGSSLGQCGIPAAPFCKEFNERSLIFKTDVILFVTLYLHITGEYNFDIHFPNNSFFFFRAVSLKHGLGKPGFIYSDMQEIKKPKYKKRFRYITPYMIYEIFLYKAFHNHLSTTYGYSFCRKALGTLKSIGIFVFNL